MTGERGDTVTIQPELVPVIRRLRVLPPWEQVVGCRAVTMEMRAVIKSLAEMRYLATMEMRDLGMTWEEIGHMTGMVKSSNFLYIKRYEELLAGKVVRRVE